MSPNCGDEDYVECDAPVHLMYGYAGAFCPCVSDEEVEEWFTHIRRVMGIPAARGFYDVRPNPEFS